MDNKEIEKINREIKILNKTMGKLEKEGFNIWANDSRFEGYGFKAILDKTWINVYVSLNYGGEDSVSITKFEKTFGNLLDSFSCKELEKRKTEDFSEIYDIVKEMIGNKD